jgi:acyl-CoA dehydrogenase
MTDEMPFVAMLMNAYHLGLADGPTEVHKVTVARELLSRATPTDGLFPTTHIPAKREEALARYADVLAAHGRANV